MWAWAIINKTTGKLVEEGFVFEEDAKECAEEMGEDFIVELLPL
jgi:hypothetical protein